MEQHITGLQSCATFHSDGWMRHRWKKTFPKK